MRHHQTSGRNHAGYTRQREYNVEHNQCGSTYIRQSGTVAEGNLYSKLGRNKSSATVDQVAEEVGTRRLLCINVSTHMELGQTARVVATRPENTTEPHANRPGRANAQRAVPAPKPPVEKQLVAEPIMHLAKLVLCNVIYAKATAHIHVDRGLSGVQYRSSRACATKVATGAPRPCVGHASKRVMKIVAHRGPPQCGGNPLTTFGERRQTRVIPPSAMAPRGHTSQGGSILLTILGRR